MDTGKEEKKYIMFEKKIFKQRASQYSIRVVVKYPLAMYAIVIKPHLD